MLKKIHYFKKGLNREYRTACGKDCKKVLYARFWDEVTCRSCLKKKK